MTRGTTKKTAEAKPAEAPQAEAPQPEAESRVITRDEALRQSYHTATNLLREKHLKEFNALRAAEAKKLGHDWKPKPTDAERREQQLRALLEEDPSLRERILAEQNATVED